MSKRKADVNDIIFEIDSEDVDSSSEDEIKTVKNKVHETKSKIRKSSNEAISVNSSLDVVNVDSSGDEVAEVTPDLVINIDTQNGGKTDSETVEIEETLNLSLSDQEPNLNDCLTEEINATCIDEDIIVDSPSSNSSLNIVAGCENRLPLITVKFRDSKLAKMYKAKIKEFMVSLIKIHDEQNSRDFNNDADLELDIWPDDLVDDEDKLNIDDKQEEVEDNLFFVDTLPNENKTHDVPEYSQATSMLSNIEECESSPPVLRRGPTCFNCDGAHPLRDCIEIKNHSRIAENRKAMQAMKVGRYHVEDDQKFGHLIAGRISGKLRHALGLKRDDIPLHIYRMRILGYPPGWLEEARISHSGIVMFGSTGTAIQDPEEEEGEVYEPGSKDKFDIKKILDFPGFNVPASSRYKERGHLYGFPPMSDEDSKLNMLQVLAPNAMKAYKRKKLAFFPSASPNNSVLEGHAEMDLDDGDEVTEFPSVPPLPDEAPPPPPPPPPKESPPLPPEEPPPPAEAPPPPPESPDLDLVPLPADVPLEINTPTELPSGKDDSPIEITCDDELAGDEMDVEPTDNVAVDVGNGAPQPGGRDSPSLDDLEERKRLLLEALDVKASGAGTPDRSLQPDNVPQDTDHKNKEEPLTEDSELPTTPQSKSIDKPTAGCVKDTSYGTPVLNIASSYMNLPSDTNFTKDICDVINFENLPDSTGKYLKICSLLKRVKSEVDRIQES